MSQGNMRQQSPAKQKIQKTETVSGWGNSPRKKNKKNKKGAPKWLKFLEGIPFTMGIVICVAVLCVSLLVGNARSLGAATSEAMKEWDVAYLVEDRVGQAKNLLKLCERNDISQELVDALKSSSNDLDHADGVADTMRKNDALQTAASNVSSALLASGMSTSDEKSLSSVMDEFAEQGNMLRYQAREYNEHALEALALYEKLPTKFLLPRPDYVQGL